MILRSSMVCHYNPSAMPHCHLTQFLQRSMAIPDSTLAPASNPNQDNGSGPDMVTKLTIKVDMGKYIRKAAMIDHQRAKDGIEDDEGTEVWAPPLQKSSNFDFGYSSTPPSSPETPPLTLDVLPIPFDLPPHDVTRTPTDTPSGKTDARKKKQAAASKRRKAKREEEKGAKTIFSYKIKPQLSRLWSRPQATKIKYPVTLLHHSPNPFEGKRQPQDRGSPWTLEELKARGFRLVEWDGR